MSLAHTVTMKQPGPQKTNDRQADKDPVRNVLLCILLLILMSASGCLKFAPASLSQSTSFGALMTFFLGPGPKEYMLGGNVTGLAVGMSGLVLKNTDGETITVNSNGTFVLPKGYVAGTPYSLTVAAFPTDISGNPEVCPIAGGNGTMGAGDALSVSVACQNAALIKVTVNGLAGKGLVLLNNGGDPLTLTGPLPNGSTPAFFTPLGGGDSYTVSVDPAHQPTQPWQTCSVAPGGPETVTGGLPAILLSLYPVTCTTNSYPAKVTILGLNAPIDLSLNGSPAETFFAPGSSSTFTTSATVLSGTAYTLSIANQPAGQSCNVVNPTGTMAGSPALVTINCSTNTFVVEGSINVTGGLNPVLGSGLGLTLTGGFTSPYSSPPIPALSTGYAIGTPVNAGAPYTVTITSNPTNPDAVCTFTANGLTTFSGAMPVSGNAVVDIACVTNSYPVKVDVEGLTSGTLTVTNTHSGNVDSVPITTNGITTVTANQYSGETYVLGFSLSGSTQQCSMGNPTGIMGSAPVTVSIVCVNPNLVGGSIRPNPGVIFPVPIPAATGTTGAVATTIAGSFPSNNGGIGASSGSTPASGSVNPAAARFVWPSDMTTDGNSLFILDDSSPSRIVRMDHSGTVTLIANLIGPYYNMTTDGTYLYATSPGLNNIVRVPITGGAATLFAGSSGGVSGYADQCGGLALFSGPDGITTDGTFLYVIDNGNNLIRKVSIATGCVTTLSTNTNPLSVTSFGGMTIIGTDLYVSESAVSRISRINLTTGAVSYFITAGLNAPYLLTNDGVNLYINDWGNNRILRADPNIAESFIVIVGTTVAGFSDGMGTSAAFSGSEGITSDGYNLYVTDFTGYAVRRIENGLGLIAYYTFNANSVNDLSFNQPSLITVGGPGFDVDRYGNPNFARSFSGGGDYFFGQPTSGLPGPSAPRTICTWVKPGLIGGSTIGIGGYGQSILDSFTLNLDPGGHLVAQSGLSSVSSASTISVGVYSHVCVVYSAGTATFYVNGAAAGSGGLPDALLSNLNIYIGYSPGATSPYFTGSIDEFRIYNRALSAGEIYALYRQF